jgi:2-polyprenyl-3-methyl-5-hydroxy-6-metoxy-1,4-benzoquinol methylase
MNTYKINHIKINNEICNTTNGNGVKEIFFDDNLSMKACIAMLLGIDIKDVKNAHRSLYSRYLGGFVFDSFELLPPLCIIHIIYNEKPHNAIFYNQTVYDPVLGVYNVDEYKNIKLKIIGYMQIFIEEAYKETEWKPQIPEEIMLEFEKDCELKKSYEKLSAFQQSKILNYIYSFSKPSSLKESRTAYQKLRPWQVEQIVNDIRKSDIDNPQKENVWEELYKWETIEAVDILKKCGISEGMTVLDMGCGHGHYTIPASIAAGKRGKVIAVDFNKKVLKDTEKRISEKNLNNVTFLCKNERELDEYKNKIDFIILYDVLHGLFPGSDWKETRKEIITILSSLLNKNGILSMALYSEIERKVPTDSKPTPKGYYKTVPISHEEAIEPYINLIEDCGFQLNNIVKNGGVHFDDFHSNYHWRKYGEVRISSLERRNIYNFIKL